MTPSIVNSNAKHIISLEDDCPSRPPKKIKTESLTSATSFVIDLTDDVDLQDDDHGTRTDPIANLNPEQQLAIDLAKQSHNVFITGQGGVGKSLVLREIISHLKAKYERGEWVALAPTGLAASELENGRTVHGFSGCGVPELVGDFGKCWDRKEDWRKVKAIIIDEISMISGEFLDNLNNVVSNIRSDKEENNSDLKEHGTQHGKEKAFGGIQMILSGDFLQLPPISKNCHDVKEILKNTKYLTQADLHLDRGFAFQSHAWKKMNLNIIQLTHIYRQDNLEFQEVLSEIRLGKVSAKSQEFLEKCRRDLPMVNDIRPTILYPRNIDVDIENMAELGKLSTDLCTFNAVDDVSVDNVAVDDAYELQYLTQGEERRSREEIEEDFQEILWSNSFYSECIAQPTLKLKEGSQVMLIKNEIGERKRLVNGSRGVVIGFVDEPNEAFVDIENEYKSKRGTLYPVVRFHCGITKVIVPEEFSKTLAGLGKCIRTAIPLKLAWAITVHKAQGMSIDYVKIDVSKVFMEGQTYVALSRARSERGLDLKGFDTKKVRADRRALEFYDNPNRDFPHWREPWTTAEEAMSAEQKVSKLEIPDAKPGSLQGVTFVFTGEPTHITRTDAEELVKACGGYIRGAVSGTTNYLVIGHLFDDGRDVTTGRKYERAKEIISGPNRSNLKIINEAQFFDVVRNSNEKKPTSKSIKTFFGAKPKR